MGACDLAPAAEAVSTGTYALSSGRAIVFPATQGAQVLEELRQCDGSILAVASPGWDPPRAVIEQVDSLLPRQIDRALEEIRPGMSRTHPGTTYLRQYLGVMRDGKRLILVNAFYEGLVKGDIAVLKELYEKQGHPSPVPYDFWKRGGYDVCDAGTQQLRAFYDPRTGRLSAIRFSDAIYGRVRPEARRGNE